MNDILRLRKPEWLTLAATMLVLALFIYLINSLGQSSLSIGGQPHFESSIGKGKLEKPMAVVTFKNYIAVTNSSGGNVRLFRANKKLDKTIKLPKGAYPSSLAISKNGVLYIGDIVNSAVYKSNILAGSVKAEKLAIKKKFKPLAMAIHGEDLIFFDGLSQKLKALDKDLRVRNFSKGKKVAISFANGIVSDGDYVYVSDSNGRKVLRFDGKGNYTQDILKNFSLPRGITVDKLRRIHIVDTFAHTIKVYSKDGKFLFNYGKEGSANENLYLPNSITIDSNRGKIYIADKGNNQIKIWSW